MTLRHTTASLLMMAGANPAAVQRILRHSDLRITTEVYGHLAPDYLHAEIDRLTFGMSPKPPASNASLNLAALPRRFCYICATRDPDRAEKRKLWLGPR